MTSYRYEDDEQTRRRILEVAGARFLAHGFSSTTMDRLATELGMSKKTIYRFWGSKTDLVREYVNMRLARVGTHIEAVFAAADLSVVERFSGILELVAQQLSAIGEAFLEDLSRHAPEVWRDIEDFRERMVFSRIAGLIEEGIREGVVHPDIRPAVVARLIATAARRLVTPDSLRELDIAPTAAIETLKRLLYGGLFTGEARARIEEKEHSNAHEDE